MAHNSTYVAKLANKQGDICWSNEENHIWHDLLEQQLACIEQVACPEYIQGLEKLNFPREQIPQLSQINKVLLDETNWQCHAVPALIGFEEFFSLLAQRKFPVATFIRSRDDFHYLKEPDIFHELFGHCPLLTNASFANYTQAYGQMALQASHEQRVFLARLYWFTVEFGLIENEQGLKAYGGGILSSPKETQYALYSNQAKRQTLTVDNLVDVFRTPYKINHLQPIYYTLERLTLLDDIRQYQVEDTFSFIQQAKEQGLFPSFYS